MIRAALVLAALAGCLEEDAVTCGDGRICPAGTACASIGEADPLCIDPHDVGTCTAGGESCTPAAGGMGECFEAAEGFVCMGEVCGDGVAAAREQCDDGNQVTGDGCAADCMSNETCGNRVTDGVRFEQCDDGNRLAHDGCDSGCRPERAVWTRLDIDRMPPRFGAAMAYDTSRGVTVLFGGSAPGSPNTYFDDTWLWNGRGWSRAAATAAPSPRLNARMVFDSARGRIVLFGGSGVNGTLGDTWEWDGTNWLRRATPTSPSPRESTQLAYDSKRKVTVLFGGIKFDTGTMTPTATADTWEWDGTTWTQRTPTTNATAREGGAMVYDARRGRVVMFGGSTGGPAVPALVWEYDGTTWTSASPTPSPPARKNTAMAFDTASGKALLFGGFGTSSLDDLWSWDGTRWTLMNVVGRPAARDDHAVAYDVLRGRFVVTAGITSAGTIESSALTWEWSGTAWTGGGPLPDPKRDEYRGAALDPLRGRAVFVDIESGTTTESDGRSWFVTGADGPTRAPPIYDQRRKQVLVFGGDMPSTGLDNETRVWNGTAWTTLPFTTRPPARRGHAMAYDSAHGEAVLFGGVGAEPFADTWLLGATGWREVQPATKPAGRVDAVMAYDPVHGKLVLFGGVDSDGILRNDTWLWTGTDWQDVTAAGPRPLARGGASISFDGARGRIVMFGGGDAIQGQLDDLWEWGYADAKGVEHDGWVPISTDVSPPHRRDAAMFPSPDGAGIFVLNGHGPGFSAYADDQWFLRWESTALDEACLDAAADGDGDGAAGCADLDCWAFCTPMCPPGASCDATLDWCGDGRCGLNETCRMCPGDCGPCAPACGDGFCDSGESCPGDCP